MVMMEKNMNSAAPTSHNEAVKLECKMTIKSGLQTIISSFFSVDISQITEWRRLRGCNYNYSFCIKGEKYVIRKFRPPHLDTAASERAAYTAIKPLGVSDEVVYFDDAGIKIARFIEGESLGYGGHGQEEAIALLRRVHENAPSIPYSYDIFRNIGGYAAFCKRPDSPNLQILKGCQKKLDAIRIKLDSLGVTPVLCHGDPCVNGNILRLKDGSLRIIDWECAGMADPLLDIALAAVHQGFDNVDPFRSAELYLRRKPDSDGLYRLKAYITLGAFELAAWQINGYGEDEFLSEIEAAREPYGLLD
jgi:thiamine kinase-like enzyme